MVKGIKGKIAKGANPVDLLRLSQVLTRGMTRALTSRAFERVVVIRVEWDYQPHPPMKRESDALVETFRGLYHYEILDVSLPINKAQDLEVRNDRVLPFYFDKVMDTLDRMCKPTDHLIFYYRGYGGTLPDKPNELMLWSDSWIQDGIPDEQHTSCAFSKFANRFKSNDRHAHVTYLMDCCAAYKIIRAMSAQKNVTILVASGETGKTRTGRTGFTPNVNEALVKAAASREYMTVGMLFANLLARSRKGDLALAPIYNITRDDTDYTASPRLWPVESNPQPMPKMKEVVLQENIAKANARPESVSVVLQIYLSDCSPGALLQIENCFSQVPLLEADHAKVQILDGSNGRVLRHWERAQSGYIIIWIDAYIWCELEDIDGEEFDVCMMGIRGDIRTTLPAFAWTGTGQTMVPPLPAPTFNPSTSSSAKPRPASPTKRQTSTAAGSPIRGTGNVQALSERFDDSMRRNTSPTKSQPASSAKGKERAASTAVGEAFGSENRSPTRGGSRGRG